MKEDSLMINGGCLWKSNLRPHNIQLKSLAGDCFAKDGGLMNELTQGHNLDALLKKIKSLAEVVNTNNS